MSARILLAIGLLLTAAGLERLWTRVTIYLGQGSAVSSTSGERVFRLPDGELASFPTFTLGVEPVLLGVGLLVLVFAAVAAAYASSRNRAATAGANAAAHTR